MATTAFNSTNHSSLVVQKWSSKLFTHAMKENPFTKFMGTGEDSMIQVNKDFVKEAGDKITFALRALDNSDGQGDDGTYEGNEAAMTFYSCDVQIHERGHSQKLNGNMTEQRTIINLREAATKSLGEWYARVLATDISMALSGLGNVKLTGLYSGEAAVDASSTGLQTVNQVTVANAGTYRRFYGGQLTAGTLTSVTGVASIANATSFKFGTQVISHVKRMAEQYVDYSNGTTGAVLNQIRPIMVNGKKHYVMLIHPLQAKDLREETAWLQAQREANVRGEANPIFTGAYGVWDNVIIHVNDYAAVRYGESTQNTTSEYFDNASDVCASGVAVARGLFCGAQAGLLAFGKMPSFTEKSHDYNTKYGVHTDVIYGVKKPTFNSQAFGCITVDTAVSLPS